MDQYRFFLLCFTLSIVKASLHFTSLNGQHLKLATADLPPVTRILRDSNGNITGYSGIVFEYIKWLSKRLNFTYSVYLNPNNSIGVNVNGQWTGTIGDLQKKAVDVGALGYAISSDRFQVMDFGVQCGWFRSTMLIRYPVSEKNMFAVLKPFQYQVWIALAACLVTVVAVIHCQQRIQRQMQKHYPTRSHNIEVFVYVIGIITSQGGYCRLRGNNIRLLASTWCIAAFILVNVYNSVLTSYLSVSYPVSDVNSLEELARKPNYQLLTIKGAISESIILKRNVMAIQAATSGYQKILGDSLRRHPKNRLSNEMTNGPSLVLQGNYVFLSEEVVIKSFVGEDYKKAHKCRLATADEYYNPKYFFMGFPKNSPWREIINRESLKSLEWGLGMYWEKLHNKYRDQCKKKYKELARSPSLSLANLWGSFIILFTGLVCSLLCYFLEMLCFYLFNQRK